MTYQMFLSNLRKAHIRDLLIMSALVLYSLGYLVSSLYVGSLGILNFDLLRTRYLLVGGMFVFYLLLIIVPLYALYERLRGFRGPDKTLKAQIDAFLLVTGTVAFGLWIIDFIFRSLFSFNQLPVGVPGFTEGEIYDWGYLQLWSDVFSKMSFFLLRIEGVLVAFTLLGIIIVVFYNTVLAIQQKQKIREYLRITREKIKGVAKDLLLSSTFQIPVLLISAFLSTLSFAGGFLGSENSFFIDRGINWGRLAGVVFVIYMLFALLILSASFVGVEPFLLGLGKKEEDLIDRLSRGIFTTLSAFGLVLLAITHYAFRVYPFIPQQIGGGRPIQVNLQSKTMSLPDEIDRYYLIDSAASSMVLLGTTETGELRVFNYSVDDLIFIEFVQEINEE